MVFCTVIWGWLRRCRHSAPPPHSSYIQMWGQNAIIWKQTCSLLYCEVYIFWESLFSQFKDSRKLVSCCRALKWTIQKWQILICTLEKKRFSLKRYIIFLNQRKRKTRQKVIICHPIKCYANIPCWGSPLTICVNPISHWGGV